MSILDRFRHQPEWKNPDPNVRAAAVRGLGAAEHQDLLVDVARSDADAHVRRAAVRKVASPAVVVELSRTDADEGVREAALETLLAFAVASDAGAAASAAAALEHPRHLAAIARDAALGPVRLDAVAKEIVLGIHVAGQPYAMRLSDAAGIHADKKITRVPGGVPALRGIAGFRGVLMPVYDLHVLLGHPSSEPPRWLVISSAAPVAFTFTAFAGQLRVSPNEIMPQSARPGATSYVGALVRTSNFIGPILHMPTILDAIKASRPGTSQNEE